MTSTAILLEFPVNDRLHFAMVRYSIRGIVALSYAQLYQFHPLVV